MKSEQSGVFAVHLQRYEVLKFDKHPNDLKTVMDFARQDSTGIAVMGGFVRFLVDVIASGFY